MLVQALIAKIVQKPLHRTMLRFYRGGTCAITHEFEAYCEHVSPGPTCLETADAAVSELEKTGFTDVGTWVGPTGHLFVYVAANDHNKSLAVKLAA